MEHSHSFWFCKKGSTDEHKIKYTSSETVLQALQRSSEFNDLVNNQTFFIERGTSSTGGFIAKHFPCDFLVEGELLYIHTFKMNEQETDVEDAQEDPGSASDDKITFTVASKGGKNTKTKQIVQNKKIWNDFNMLCVYAYSDDTIEKALRRDGRFAGIVFDDGKLHDLNDKTIKLELSQNVRALKGHSYEICLPRGTPLKSTEKSNTEQKAAVKAESSTVGDTESESRAESTMTKSGKTDNQEKKTHKKSSNMPDFGEIYDILRSQFPELVKCMEARKSKLSKEYLQLRKEDFAQSTRAFSTMCQVEKLVNLGTSVCMVKTANMHGTGFLLFDNFILTNAHVIEESYDIQSKKLTSAATVNFNMGSGKSLDREFPLSSDVFAVWKGRDDAGRYVDFALLKLQDCEEIMKNEDIPKLPRLLKEYTSNQHAGGICIIGHPGSELKRMAVSCIVPHTETKSAPAESILVHFSFDPDYIQSEYRIEGCNIATYRTYFLKGSSGSPVFDEDCKLVAMHTGGFLTDEIRERAIGFAIPLHSIIQNIIKQLDSRESLDAMFRFIENSCLEEYLKESAESLMRNPSDENAEMLVKICFETKRNGMLNMFQMIQEELDKNKKYFEQILQKIARYRAHQEEE